MTGSTSTDVRRILPLNPEAVTQIHSSKHITSLQGVVLSLLENSLDAGSTRICISVDWKRGCCTVDDNGVGIPSAEFADNGGLGKMYCTSKRAPVGTQPDQRDEVHGLNGMFVAELAAMSLLSITSTPKSTGQPASITFHQGEVLARHLPDQGLLDNAQPSGTSVVVKDLFGNMPVRIKQRALSHDRFKTQNPAWQELKRGTVAFLQAWMRPCSVRLQDFNEESRTINLAGQHHSVSTSLTAKSLHRLGGKNTISRYDLCDALPMLFQAGLASSDTRQRWVPVAASSAYISLNGLICLDPAPTKRCQFISIGIRPCGSTSGQTELHDILNKVFDNSDFGMKEEFSRPAAKESPSKTRSASSGGRSSQLRKGIDCHPMYSLRINILATNSATAMDPDRLSASSLAAIGSVMTAAAHAWLEKHHFRPMKRQRRQGNQPEAPSTRTTLHTRPTSARSNTPLGSATGMQGLQEAGTWSRDPIDMDAPPKRRKVIDLSLRPASHHDKSATQLHSPLGLDHGALSNIRTGGPRARSDQQSSRQNEQGPSPLHDRAHPPPGSGRLDVGIGPHEIEIRALNGRPHNPPVEISTSKAQSRCQYALGETLLSDDDFGSIDDSELIAAEGGNRNVLHSQQAIPQASNTGEDATMTWTDPATSQVFSVNARTGVVLPTSGASLASGTDKHEPPHTRQRAGIDTMLSSSGKPLGLTRRKALAARDESTSVSDKNDKWLPGFLREWNNPVFARQDEAPIPTTSLHGPGVLRLDENGRCCSHDADGRHSIDRNALQIAGSRLSKAALHQAEVIGQVDRKFILCKLLAAGTDENDTFVLIDQHAASERIILEDLFADFCDPVGRIKTASLEHETTKAKPLHFQVSSQEHDLFQRHRQHFATWGIHYILNATNASPILKLTHLPTLVAARCVHLPSLAIDLLRSELWVLADGSKRSLDNLPLKPDEDASPPWLTLLPLMPTKLLEMLHSRSCRSAIMFNDILSRKECKDLMRKVAMCVFPFVCAHGRVGMVPVLEMGNGRGQGLEVKYARGVTDNAGDEDDGNRERICGADALGKWMAEDREM